MPIVGVVEKTIDGVIVMNEIGGTRSASTVRRGRVFAATLAAVVAMLAALVAPAPPAQATGTPGPGTVPGSFGMQQTLSDGAQRTTIAFDALAFLTGNLGTDSFFPPGKVADFWGFQYLRDNDPSGMGHNTDFLTKASLNTLTTLNTSQRARLIALAKSQVGQINDYGYQRFVLMSAFRRQLSGQLPAGSTGLSESAVKAYSANLYRLDGQISQARAVVMGSILSSLSAQQKATLDAMVGKGMTSWPAATEPSELRGLSHDEKVAVMTYAGDMFSWYAGSITADVYFCPERQGTYFGSFYLKDAPAVGNPGYSIGTNITADMGNAFLSVLTPAQSSLIESLVTSQKPSLLGIVNVRTQVAAELRKNLAGKTSNAATIATLMGRYGELDGAIVYKMASNFAKINATLTTSQKAALTTLRKQTIGDLAPTGAYLFAQAIPFPTIRSTDFLFTTPRPALAPVSSTVVATTSRVPVGAYAKLAGTISSRASGIPVRIVTGSGKVVALVRTTAGGRWTASFHPFLGTMSYRALVSANASYASGTSRSIVLTGTR